jgi:hypothetical protein
LLALTHELREAAPGDSGSLHGSPGAALNYLRVVASTAPRRASIAIYFIYIYFIICKINISFH